MHPRESYSGKYAAERPYLLSDKANRKSIDQCTYDSTSIICSLLITFNCKSQNFNKVIKWVTHWYYFVDKGQCIVIKATDESIIPGHSEINHFVSQGQQWWQRKLKMMSLDGAMILVALNCVRDAYVFSRAIAENCHFDFSLRDAFQKNTK